MHKIRPQHHQKPSAVTCKLYHTWTSTL